MTESRGVPTRWRGRAQHLGLALVAYVPLLLTHRGMVSADTKTYLYLDPSRLLAKAPYLWDSGTGLGTVTHQTLGYLFPMGPYYWLMEQLGLPDWVAQRIWLGTILFAAGAGVLFLMRTMGWRATEPAALARHGRRRCGLHALPLRPRLRRPHLGDPAAVGGAPLAHRARDACRHAKADGDGRRGSRS